MPRKKISVAEDLPAEKPTKKQIVDAKHVVTYNVPEVVDVPLTEEEIFLDDLPDEFEQEQIRNRPPTVKAKLREKFARKGIGGDEILNLRIDRLPNFEINGLAGIKSDKEFCGTIQCTDDYFDNENYLNEILRRYGPGEYWLTIRHKTAILQQWRERIGGFPTVPPIVAENGAQASPPFYPYSQAPQPIKTIKDELRDVAEMMALMDKIRGPAEPAQNTPLLSEEVQVASLLLKDPSNAKRMARNLLGGEGEKDMWSLALENGPAIIQAFGDMLIKVIGNVKGDNGQTQTPPQTFPQSGSVNGNEHPSWRIDPTQTQSQGMQGVQSGAIGSGAPPVNAPTSGSPDEQILSHLFSYVIEQCQSATNPELVAAGIDRFMDEQVSQDFPLYCDKIWSQLEMFAGMETDAVLAYVGTLPNGATVAELPHAKEWTAKLQELLKPSEETEAA